MQFIQVTISKIDEDGLVKYYTTTLSVGDLVLCPAFNYRRSKGNDIFKIEKINPTGTVVLTRQFIFPLQKVQTPTPFQTIIARIYPITKYDKYVTDIIGLASLLQDEAQKKILKAEE